MSHAKAHRRKGRPAEAGDAGTSSSPVEGEERADVQSGASPNPIIDLVARLEGDEPVPWDEVDACLADYPGWAGFADALRDPGRMPYFLTQNPVDMAHITFVGRREASALLQMLKPFALLLDSRRTPAERVQLLRKELEDSDEFLDGCWHNASADVRAAAEEVLTAAEFGDDLLRPADSPPPEEGLLRPASDTDDSSLLHPADEAAEPPRLSWWQRLVSRRERGSQ
jgi:hypothetical protein